MNPLSQEYVATEAVPSNVTSTEPPTGVGKVSHIAVRMAKKCQYGLNNIMFQQYLMKDLFSYSNQVLHDKDAYTSYRHILPKIPKGLKFECK